MLFSGSPCSIIHTVVLIIYMQYVLSYSCSYYIKIHARVIQKFIQLSLSHPPGGRYHINIKDIVL